MPIPASLRAELAIEAAHPAAGGCIHRCHRVRIRGRLRFLKSNEPRFADAFAAEADGLQALRAAGMQAPAPLAHGATADSAYLLLEYLDLAGGGDFAALGRSLAAMHRNAACRYGWARDNYIGTTAQQNGWQDDWKTFWLQRRLRPQLALARSNGFSLPEPDLAMLEDHCPPASLLHGDLWSGNVGFTQAGPVVFDPAVYYGDREADLAMSELFGRFPEPFYRAYEDAYPLAPGYARRRPLYNLYHLLNHLNLFGRGYLARVNQTLSLLLLG